MPSAGRMEGETKSTSTMEDVGKPSTQPEVNEQFDLRQLWGNKPYSDPDFMIYLSLETYKNYRAVGHAVDLLASKIFLDQAFKIVPEGYSKLADLWTELADRLNCMYERNGLASINTQAIAAGNTAVSLIPDEQPEGQAHALTNLATSWELKYQRGKLLSDLTQAIEVSERAYGIVQSDEEIRRIIAQNLANQLELHFVRCGDPESLQRAISIAEEIYQGCTADDVLRAEAAVNLAVKLLFQYDAFKGSTSLTRSISLLEEALDVTTPDHPFRFSRLTNLSNAFLRRGQLEHRLSDLSRAEQLCKEALSIIPPTSSQRIPNTRYLADLLEKKFVMSSQVADIDGAIEWSREVLHSLPDADLASPTDISLFLRSMRQLHHRYQLKYEITQDQEALLSAQAIGKELHAYNSIFSQMGSSEELDPRLQSRRVHQQQQQRTRNADVRLSLHDRQPEYAGSSVARAEIATEDLVDDSDSSRAGPRERTPGPIVRAVLFERALSEASGSNDLQALIRAVEQGRKELRSVPARDERLASLWQRNVLRSVHSVLEGSRFPEDFEVFKTWVFTSLMKSDSDDSIRAGIIHMLSGKLFSAFEASGSGDYLDLAIQVLQEAISVLSPFDPRRYNCLGDLATFHLWRFRQSGDVHDLQNSVFEAEQSVSADFVPAGQRMMAWNALSLALNARYEHSGNLVDLIKAIDRISDAIMTIPSDEKGRDVLLANLAVFLQHQYDRNRSKLDLEKGIVFVREAMSSPELEQSNPLKAVMALSVLLGRKGDEFSESVLILHEQVAKATPLGSSSRALRLHNYSVSLRKRFEKSGNSSDIDEAVRLGIEIMELVSTTHPSKGRFSTAVGNTFHVRYTALKQQGDLERSVAAFREALECTYSATPSERIHAACRAAGVLIQEAEYSKARYFLEEAINILPLLSPTWLDDDDKQAALGKIYGLPADAAIVAILTGATPVHALSLLEMGRGLIFGAIIDGRSDSSRLREINAELYDKFEKIRRQLNDRAPEQPEIAKFTLQKRQVDMAAKRRAEAEQLQSVLLEIRSLKGLERFQLPPQEEELMRIAEKGPIVVVVNGVQIDRTYAITVTREETKALELSKMISADIKSNLEALKSARQGSLRTFAARSEKMKKCLAWLWDVAVGPILDSLGLVDGSTVNGSLPRVYWIGVGFLSQFPFHAAGHVNQGGRCAIERVMSSYIATIKALGYTRERQLRFSRDRTTRVLVATCPQTPGHKDLPGTEAEAEKIAGACRASATVITMTRPDSNALLEGIRACNIAHFACHGKADPLNPFDSHLLLLKTDVHGNERIDKLSVSAIRQKMSEDAGLAFLSGCSTAENASLALPDEVIHLAWAFQLAGFSHVVGTMWNTKDEACMFVAQKFYATLFAHQTSDGDDDDHHRVAVALHEALIALRSSKRDNPLWWASFVHFGA